MQSSSTKEKKSSGNASTNEPRAQLEISEYQKQLGLRANIEGFWQSLHDYFYIESPDVNRMYMPGNELNSQNLWDATTLECGDVFASGFMNYLTPPTSNWGRIRSQNSKIAQSKPVIDFYEDVNAEVIHTLNRSNFYEQMFPAYKGSGVFGTSLIFEEEDIHDEARFYNMPLKQVVIVEDARGRVCKYFIVFEYTAEQAASRWGVEALSREMQDEIGNMKGGDKKHEFLLVIGERYRREIQKTDKKNLPIEALWIDVEGKMTIEESGYHEFPAFCHRFDKRPFMPWGFSPAMKALPFARMLNQIAKTNLRAMMKATDPPQAVPNNAFIAPFNQNPRAVNYYKKDMMPDKGIFPFGNYGNPEAGMAAIEYYSNQVKTLMYNDVFLAFSNITKDMNNPEIMERINEKMTMLGPAVGRWISEVIKPVYIRTIGILWRRGKLPEPPDEVRQDPSYEIDFLGVLAQSQRRAELNTLMTGLQIVGQMGQYAPEAMDKINPDKVTDEVWDITGASVKVLRDDGEIQKIREQRAKNAVQAQQMMMADQAAEIGKKAGAAAAGFAKSKEAGAGKK